MKCWLKQFSTKERACYGRQDRAHLLPQQLLKREGLNDLLSDPRVWVPACRTHHQMLDGYSGIVIPYESLPTALLSLCEELGLGWYLDRRYRPLSASLSP